MVTSRKKEKRKSNCFHASSPNIQKKERRKRNATDCVTTCLLCHTKCSLYVAWHTAEKEKCVRFQYSKVRMKHGKVYYFIRTSSYFNLTSLVLRSTKITLFLLDTLPIKYFASQLSCEHSKQNSNYISFQTSSSSVHFFFLILKYMIYTLSFKSAKRCIY